MSYEINHLNSDCDKCLKRVGSKNLSPVNFLYKDLNDKAHKDLGDGYRQYYICKDCEHEEWKMDFCRKDNIKIEEDDKEINIKIRKD